MTNEEKIFFIPGNLVTLKHEIPNKPTMLVTEIVTSKIKSDNPLRGIRCIWFTEAGKLQEYVFSTKDLMKL
jgi:uncharacterized protein YodC (DUF2158 family)